jgi:hypothetical protein
MKFRGGGQAVSVCRKIPVKGIGGLFSNSQIIAEAHSEGGGVPKEVLA